MRLNKIKWEITKLFRDKRHISIKPTMRCNLYCSYCAVFNAWRYYSLEKRDVTYDELPPEWWMKLIKRVKPNVLTITGGEPGLYEGLADIVNYAVGRKILVLIFSNLTVLDEFRKIKKTWRVYFIHTQHPKTTTAGYEEISKDFHVTLRSLRTKPNRSRGEIQLRSWRDSTFSLLYAPDGRLYDCCDAIALKDNFTPTDFTTL